MILPVNNLNPTLNFKGPSLKKVPIKEVSKIKQSKPLRNFGEKMSACAKKVKTEFQNMDEESKELLYKIVVLGSVLVGFITYAVSILCRIIDKFRALFE